MNSQPTNQMTRLFRVWRIAMFVLSVILLTTGVVALAVSDEDVLPQDDASLIVPTISASTLPSEATVTSSSTSIYTDILPTDDPETVVNASSSSTATVSVVTSRLGVTITSYDENVDYQSLINELYALLDGVSDTDTIEHILGLLEIYETQRNLKISAVFANTGKYNTTTIFSKENTLEEIRDLMEVATVSSESNSANGTDSVEALTTTTATPITVVTTSGSTDSVEETTSSTTTTATTKSYTEQDAIYLACIIYAEAGSDWCTDAHQRAVASVVINRVNDDRFPDTIYDVLHEAGQYPYTCNNTTYDDRAMENAIYVLENGPTVSGVFQANFVQGSEIVAIFSYEGHSTTYICN